jgi:hypothetical protein
MDKQIVDIIDNWLTDHTCFESTKAIDAAVEKMKEAKTLNEIFSMAISRQLLNFKNALMFMHFIDVGVRWYAEEEEMAHNEKGEFEFDLIPAQEIVTKVYDIAMDEHVWRYVRDEEGSEEDEDEKTDP